MLGKAKGALLVALLGKGKSEKEDETSTVESSEEESGEGEYDEALKSGAEDLLSAIDSKDVGAIAKAFSAMHQVCAEGSGD